MHINDYTKYMNLIRRLENVLLLLLDRYQNSQNEGVDDIQLYLLPRYWNLKE